MPLKCMLVWNMGIDSHPQISGLVGGQLGKCSQHDACKTSLGNYFSPLSLPAQAQCVLHLEAGSISSHNWMTRKSEWQDFALVFILFSGWKCILSFWTYHRSVTSVLWVDFQGKGAGCKWTTCKSITPKGFEYALTGLNRKVDNLCRTPQNFTV